MKIKRTSFDGTIEYQITIEHPYINRYYVIRKLKIEGEADEYNIYSTLSDFDTNEMDCYLITRYKYKEAKQFIKELS